MGTNRGSLPLPVKILCAIVVVAIFVAIIGMVVEAAAQGGYHPVRYAGRFDPFRAGGLVILVPGVLLGVVWVASALDGWRSKAPWRSWAQVALTVGFLLCAISVVALVLWYPSAPGPMAVPTPIRVMVLVGIGLMTIGLVPGLVSSFRDAIRRRDVGVLLALALLAALIVSGIARKT